MVHGSTIRRARCLIGTPMPLVVALRREEAARRFAWQMALSERMTARNRIPKVALDEVALVLTNWKVLAPLPSHLATVMAAAG